MKKYPEFPFKAVTVKSTFKPSTRFFNIIYHGDANRFFMSTSDLPTVFNSPDYVQLLTSSV